MRSPEKSREEWEAAFAKRQSAAVSASTPGSIDDSASRPPKFAFHVTEGTAAYRFLTDIEKPGFRKFLDDIKVKYDAQEDAAKSWRDSFKSRDQLEVGDVRMLIKDFLPEGINFIGALPGHGKTQFVLSMVKALTTGSLFLGKYKPEQIFPVLYLIPESSGRAFRMRLNSFGIPNDPERFLCRTISEGVILKLDDPIVLKAVEMLKPIVVLDTMIRFSDASDENSAAQNQAIAKNILDLRAAGAPAVIALHHSIKSFAEGDITLESCLRGTGDIAALCDSVYALRRDRVLHDNGNGPEELEVVCVKDRDIAHPPKPFRVALRYIKEDGTRASYIDESGDIHMVESAAVQADLDSRFVKLVTEDSSVSREDIAKELRLSSRHVRLLAKRLGWNRSVGRYGSWVLMAEQNDSAAREAAKRKEASDEESKKEKEAPTEMEKSLF